MNDIFHKMKHSLIFNIGFIASTVADFIRAKPNRSFLIELAGTPKIAGFLFRPYVNRHWTAVERIGAIKTHYLIISECFPHLNIGSQHYVDVCNIRLPLGDLRIVIDRPEWMRREGELGISLFWGVDRIYTSMMLFGRRNGSLHLTIGNLQGDGRSRSELYKYLTRSLHGMRPRDLLLHIVKHFARLHDCDRVYGVSDAAHRSAHWASRAQRVSGYNEIWIEHKGSESSQFGFFGMPVSGGRRDEEDIPSRKRALYRRRYEMLDELDLKLASFFERFKERQSGMMGLHGG